MWLTYSIECLCKAGTCDWRNGWCCNWTMQLTHVTEVQLACTTEYMIEHVTEQHNWRTWLNDMTDKCDWLHNWQFCRLWMLASACPLGLLVTCYVLYSSLPCWSWGQHLSSCIWPFLFFKLTRHASVTASLYSGVYVRTYVFAKPNQTKQSHFHLYRPAGNVC